MAEPFDEQISSVEDLDPERPTDARRLRVREVALGLVLLFGVLAWAGWDWYYQQSRQSEYASASQAAANHQWDEALAHFRAAGDFKDSVQRAAEAARLIKERDEQYGAAYAAARQGNWPSALQSARSVLEIQPRYRSLSALADEALTHVTTEALSGTVVLRATGPQPGLYYRAGDSWLYLRESDADSRVRGEGTPGHLIYDVPEPGTRSYLRIPSKQDVYEDRLQSPELLGRNLIVASIGPASVTFTPLAFESYRYWLFTWGDAGAWALSLDRGTQQVFSPGSNLPLSGFQFDYQGFSEPTSTTLKIPGPEWAVLDFAQDGRHFLLAQMPSNNIYTPKFNLFMVDGDGGDRHLIFSDEATIYRASLSPDSRYALVTTFSFDGDYHSRESVYLVDTSRDTPGRLLLSRETGTRPYEFKYPVASALFLNAGPYAGDILLGDWGANISVVSLLDPRTADSPVLHTILPVSPTRSLPEQSGWVTIDTESGAIVLAWNSELGDRNTTVVKLEPGEPAVSVEVPFAGRGSPTGVAIRARHLLFFNQRDASSDLNPLYDVTSLPLDELGKSGSPKPRLVYSADAPRIYPEYHRNNDATYTFGSGMIAYIGGGLLRARSYDGTVDVEIDTGIRTLYDYPLFRGQSRLR